MIAVAALGIEPAALGERFEQRGFAATVFTDEEGDLAAERQIDPVRESKDVERIRARVELLWQARDSVEERRARGPCRRGHPPSRLPRSTMPRAAPAIPTLESRHLPHASAVDADPVDCPVEMIVRRDR